MNNRELGLAFVSFVLITVPTASVKLDKYSLNNKLNQVYVRLVH